MTRIKFNNAFFSQNTPFIILVAMAGYLLFHLPVIHIFSIDDSLVYAGGRGASHYFENGIMRGRLITPLQALLEKNSNFDLTTAFSVLVAFYVFSIVFIVKLVSNIIGLKDNIIILCASIIIIASPMTIELLHFRIGLPQYLVVSLSTIFLFQRLMSEPQRHDIWVIPLWVVIGMTGYSSALPIIAGVFALSTMVMMVQSDKPLEILWKNAAYLIAGIIIYTIIWKLLLVYFEIEGKYSLNLSYENLNKNFNILGENMAFLLSRAKPQNPFPMIFILLPIFTLPYVLLKQSGDNSNDSHADKRLRIILLSLFTFSILFVCYFNGHTIPFEGREVPIRGFYAFMFISILVALFVYQYGNKYLKFYVKTVLIVQALIYSINAGSVNRAILQLWQQENIVYNEIIQVVEEFDGIPDIYISHDPRSHRFKRRYKLLYGGIKGQLGQFWSAYSYPRTIVTTEFNILANDKTTRDFDKECKARRRENFIIKVKRVDNSLFICT